jgi:protoporphyrinogen/coproporphyrinogen III oxidase
MGFGARDLRHCRGVPGHRYTAPVTEDRPQPTHVSGYPRPRVAVIGGGISGLATVYFLCRASSRPQVTVIEASNRLGGKVLTRRVGGHAVDTGTDSLPAQPALLSLLDDLGLSGAIVGAAPLGTYVWSRGKLRRLPPRTMFGMPARLSPLLRSRLLSPAGVFRAGLDLVLPRQRLPADTSLAELLRPRFGPELLERLVEPLVGGIHAGPVDQLSARSTVPDIDALARANRSLYLALRRRRRATATTSAGKGSVPAPAMLSLGPGLGQLVAAL